MMIFFIAVGVLMAPLISIRPSSAGDPQIPVNSGPDVVVGGGGSITWGIDTTTYTTTPGYISSVKTDVGSPTFIGRYIVWGAGGVLSASEAAYIHNGLGLPILLIASPGTNPNSGSQGTIDAQNAVSAAENIGVQPNTTVAIYIDIEPGTTMSASYAESWYSYLENQGFVPGFYENPNSSSFTAGFCSAVAAMPAIATGTLLYAQQPQVPQSGGTSTSQYKPGVMPTWSEVHSPFQPATPTCIGSSQDAAWQYLIRNQSIPVPVPNMDADEGGPVGLWD